MTLDIILDWLLRWSEVIGAIGSLLLSAALVYFYRDMRDVQRKQTEIQERQAHLSEKQAEIGRANHEPELRITEVSFGQRDTVKLGIENVGNGIATDLALVCVIETENDYLDVHPSVTPLTEYGDSLTDQRQSLRPGESGQFSTHVLMPVQGGKRFSDTQSWFSVVTSKLHYTGSQSAKIHLRVKYQNILDDVDTKRIMPASIMLNDNISIEGAMKQHMDEMARNFSGTTGHSLLESRHIMRDGPIQGANEIDLSFSGIDQWPMGYSMSLTIETPPNVCCEVDRDRTVVATVDESSETTVQFDGNSLSRLGHGELIHVFAVRGDERWQTDLIGAGDVLPVGPSHAQARQRMMQLK